MFWPRCFLVRPKTIVFGRTYVLRKMFFHPRDLRDAANVYPPKSNFSESHISAPRGCCAPKFLHALENDQVLLAHPPPGTGAPLQLFSKGGQKSA